MSQGTSQKPTAKQSNNLSLRQQKSWGDKKSLLTQVQKCWDNGSLLNETIHQSGLFPKRFVFKAPDSNALANEFEAVRCWVNEIQKIDHFRIVYKTIRHRVIGENRLPSEAWIDEFDTAITLLNKHKAIDEFAEIVSQIRKRVPSILSWIQQHPLKVLSLNKEWPKLLDFVCWRLQNPNPDIYLRQVNVPGIDSKFIENHRWVLASLLDLSLSTKQINKDVTGIKQFSQRYGFRSKPEKIRFRLLDVSFTIFSSSADADNDISITAKDFQEFYNTYGQQMQRVYIMENEINFLAFPPQENSLVIFGAGYGFEAMSQVDWLSEVDIFYWGDIDTHGFAILDQLRNKLPQVRSILMNKATLLDHKKFWGEERKPESRDLSRLTTEERLLYQALLSNKYKPQLRLEQERIPYEYLIKVLAEQE